MRLRLKAQALHQLASIVSEEELAILDDLYERFDRRDASHLGPPLRRARCTRDSLVLRTRDTVLVSTPFSLRYTNDTRSRKTGAGTRSRTRDLLITNQLFDRGIMRPSARFV